MTGSMDEGSVFTLNTMIPDLLRRYPQARRVLDRFGLKGCGGALGPHETLGYFARAHDVDPKALMDNLRQAVESPCCDACGDAGLQVERPSVADIIYRRFFIAGIAVILTLGATWGAALLWRIGLHQAFAGVGVNEVNAHAQAQVFGWMGMFIMGFAYQAFPRFWHTSLVAPRLAAANFWLLVAGVLMASVGMPLVGKVPIASAVATTGAVLECLSVLTFAGQLVLTFKAANKTTDAGVFYIFAALFWFSVSAVVNLVHTAATSGFLLADHKDWALAACQPVLRDMQFHGLGMSIIFGVSLRTLPAFWGLPKVPDRLALASLALTSLAVASEVVLFLAYKAFGLEWARELLIVPSLMLLGGTLCLVVPWRLWRPFPEGDRSEKFVRAGFFWLVLSLVLLLLMPLHAALSHGPLSHAYVGAIRHAITVGFISLMIMGYAAKVVPTLRGLDPRMLTSLRGPFMLVNAGCALRVVTQTLTDWYPQLFSLIGLSGTLEVAGLAWWGIHLLGVMLRQPAERVVSAPVAGTKPLNGDSIVAYVVDWYPQTEPVFVGFGFDAISNPVMRNTVGRRITLRQACQIRDVDLEALLAALNAAVDDSERASGTDATGGCGQHRCPC